MASKYRSITEALNYKLLAEALVLYKSRVRSLESIIDETSNEAKAQEYDTAYDQLLHAYQYREYLCDAYKDPKETSKDQAWTTGAELSLHDNSIPDKADLDVKGWVVRDAANHLLALKSAVEYLETTLFVIELEVENRREGETPLDFIDSQGLSSKALFQTMLRFAKYCEEVSEWHEQAPTRIAAWASRIEKLATLMATQVLIEEHERRMPPVVQGADYGEVDLAERSEDGNTGEDMENSPPEEGNDDYVDQVAPDENLGGDRLPGNLDVRSLSLDTTSATRRIFDERE